MRTHEDIIRESVRDIVKDRFDQQSILDIRFTRLTSSSWYATYDVTVQLEEDGEIHLFLKDFGSYARPREDMAQRRARECHVYENLLAEANLGTAKHYRSVCDEFEERFWLFLEFVKGAPLRYQDFHYWAAAASWLGRSQGYFNSRPDLWRDCQSLCVYDGDFFRAIAESALRTVSQISSDFVKRLTPIVNEYYKVADMMAIGPHTFVHGSYRAAQILFDPTLQHPRVCPIDWETAGTGSTLQDLAFLVQRLDPSYFETVFDAYRTTAAKYGISVCDDSKLKYIVDCYRLHKVLDWLAKSLNREYPDQLIRKLMDMAQETGDAVFTRH